jgi:23S rRNA pseudouridine1911/1915/1917 synthase
MKKILRYTLTTKDLETTAGGLVNLVLKNCVWVTGHEISAAKFTPDGITCDGQLIHVSERMQPGQTLQVILPEDPEKSPMIPVKPPEDCPLDILYEDEDIIALNKPAGVVVHPSPGHYKDTMANYVSYYCEMKGEPCVCRIAGRLDRETSGVLIFAKNRASSARLARQRQEGTFVRTYLAIVEGILPEEEAILQGAMAQVPGLLMKRKMTKAPDGKKAITHYRVLGAEPFIDWVRSAPQAYLYYGLRSADASESGTFGRSLFSMDGSEGTADNNAGADHDGRIGLPDTVSLVQLHIDTGRTHQIRLHMASIGHPLVGDLIYGSCAPEPKHMQEKPGFSKERDGRGSRAQSKAGCTDMKDMRAANVVAMREECGDQGAAMREECGDQGAASCEERGGQNAEQYAARRCRALLHAECVHFVQPFTGKPVYVRAPIPKDFGSFAD